MRKGFRRAAPLTADALSLRGGGDFISPHAFAVQSPTEGVGQLRATPRQAHGVRTCCMTDAPVAINFRFRNARQKLIKEYSPPLSYSSPSNSSP